MNNPLQFKQRRHFSARRHALHGAGLLALLLAAPLPAQTKSKTILIIGDSLSAEYGLPRSTGWVALLEKRLQQQGKAATVRNASISGETSAGGRARLAALLKTHQPSHVIIELGSNDALRGLPLSMTRDNLSAMAKESRQTGAKVLLLGMQVPPNYGADYAQQFTASFAHIAKLEKAALVPFFLKGVADAPDPLQFFQSDRIHPAQSAQAIMLDNVWAELKKIL